jgi:hypothetical protein
VVTKTLLPENGDIFGSCGTASWVLQQDYDPTHKAANANVAAWNASLAAEHSSNVAILGSWPPNSPELNPVDNVWAYVECKVN